MMYNTSFHGVLCMQNPFLMLIFKFQDKVMFKIKMVVQRQLENWTFELVVIVCCAMLL